MRPRVHVLVSLAAAAWVPSVVRASESGAVLPWLSAVLAGLLPNAVDAIVRLARRPTSTYTPDPLEPPSAIAEAAAKGVASAVWAATASGRPRTLWIRPLPSSAGTLQVRLLPDRCSARVLPTAEASAAPLSPTSVDVTLPPLRAPWPADVPVPAPDGTLLTILPGHGTEPGAIALETAVRARGLGHSAAVLVAASALFFATATPTATAAAVALLAHALLDALDLHGIPLLGARGPRFAGRRWNAEDPAANRVAAVVALVLLVTGLACHTAFLAHPRRIVAAASAMGAVALLVGRWIRPAATKRRRE